MCRDYSIAYRVSPYKIETSLSGSRSAEEECHSHKSGSGWPGQMKPANANSSLSRVVTAWVQKDKDRENSSDVAALRVLCSSNKKQPTQLGRYLEFLGEFPLVSITLTFRQFGFPFTDFDID